MSVVNPGTTQIHGVADDSAFLFVTDGSIYAPVLMVAEPFYQHQATKQQRCLEFNLHVADI